MKTIAVYNLKGGVGKTATAVNLAYLSAKQGYRTCIWDLDAQAASSWYFNKHTQKKFKVGKLVKDKVSLGDIIEKTEFPNLDVIPSDLSYRNLDVMLAGTEDNRVKQWLSSLTEIYQVVILDCPPSLSTLALGVLKQADIILAPAVPTHLSFETFRHMEDIFEEKKIPFKRCHPVLSMIDRRKTLHKEFSERCKEMLGRKPLGFIPYSSDVEKMGHFRQPVEKFAPRSVAALSYQLLWENLEKKIK